MTWVVVNKKSKKATKAECMALPDFFKSEEEAEQAIVDCIRGADKKTALRYYRNLIACKFYRQY